MRNRDPFNSMVRGFAWTTGRRMAYALPWPIAVLVIVAMHYLRSR